MSSNLLLTPDPTNSNTTCYINLPKLEISLDINDMQIFGETIPESEMLDLVDRVIEPFDSSVELGVTCLQMQEIFSWRKFDSDSTDGTIDNGLRFNPKDKAIEGFITNVDKYTAKFAADNGDGDDYTNAAQFRVEETRDGKFLVSENNPNRNTTTFNNDGSPLSDLICRYISDCILDTPYATQMFSNEEGSGNWLNLNNTKHIGEQFIEECFEEAGPSPGIYNATEDSSKNANLMSIHNQIFSAYPERFENLDVENEADTNTYHKMRFEEGDVISFKLSINASINGSNGAGSIQNVVRRAQPESGSPTTFENPISDVSDGKYKLRTANFLMSLRLTNSTDTRQFTSAEEVVSHNNVLLRHAATFKEMTLLIGHEGSEAEVLMETIDNLTKSKADATAKVADANKIKEETKSLYNEALGNEEEEREKWMEAVNNGAAVDVQAAARLRWTEAKGVTAGSLRDFNTAKREVTVHTVSLNNVSADLSSTQGALDIKTTDIGSLKQERLMFINDGYRKAIAKYTGLDGKNEFVHHSEGGQGLPPSFTRAERSKRNNDIINTMGEIYRSRSKKIYDVHDKTTGEDDDMVDLIAESSKEPQQIDFYKLVRAWEDVGQEQPGDQFAEPSQLDNQDFPVESKTVTARLGSGNPSIIPVQPPLLTNTATFPSGVQ